MDLTDVDFKNIVIDSKKAFVIQVRADWSGECYIMTSLLKQLAPEFSIDITFGAINVEMNEDITKQFGITELPFILFFNHGELVDFTIGLQSKKMLRHCIKKTIDHKQKTK
jgi:thioredoxin 1